MNRIYEGSTDYPRDLNDALSSSFHKVSRSAERPAISRSGFFDDQRIQLANNLYRHPFDRTSNERMDADARGDLHGMDLYYSAPSRPLHDLRGRFRDNEGILPKHVEEEEEEERAPGDRGIETVPVVTGRKRETGTHRPESNDSEWTRSQFMAADGRGLMRVCGSSSRGELNYMDMGRDIHRGILPDDLDQHTSDTYAIGSRPRPEGDLRGIGETKTKTKAKTIEITRSGSVMISIRPQFSLIPETSSAERQRRRGSAQGVMPFH